MKRLFLLTLIALATGCSLIKPRPASDIYVLKPANQQAVTPVTSKNLRVSLPSAAPGLDTPRIAVLEAPEKLNYYQGISWAQPFPIMAQSYLLDALRQSAAFGSVNSDRDGVYANLVLLSDIRDAQVESDNVHIRMNITLVDGDSRRILASFPAEARSPMSGGTSGMVGAFSSSMESITAEIVKKLSGISLTDTQNGQ